MDKPGFVVENPITGDKAVFLKPRYTTTHHIRRIGSALLLLAACRSDHSDATVRRAEAAGDSAFAAVQTRGAMAMGVDQYTSTHVFEPLPTGGRIVLRRDVADSAGAEQIRAHMREIATAFAAGDFRLPGFVHDREVPGTAVMAARRERITYAVESLPRGAALRIATSDEAALEAIHAFLAFQRQDHHARAHPAPDH